ncbi:NAD(P)H-dependent oxidoreductase [Galactobacter caseinivorans]|uniref:Flavodoxin family protein n=1 Tax=Galactobacter caseinivorans TaxID=2676123 RepID=A0A496PHP4_9MICC|nr:NAD(P)H-dependent oxidoreductase [Galactobacter caseinivorans]RKW70007.1 flavodoxin family protein [Galactobacter caseinivorans]
MSVLVIHSHPDPESLTAQTAGTIATSLTQRSIDVERADLHAEGFDPRFSTADLAAYRAGSTPPASIGAEQARVDRHGDLVLVYPVFWWSMPGQLKGWIDRVFGNGWAYAEQPGVHGHQKLLGDLRVHLVELAATDDATYERHGYAEAMRTQIAHGIFDYCGATVVSQIRLESAPTEAATALAAARDWARDLALPVAVH